MATGSSKIITPGHQSLLLYSMDGTQYKEQVTVHQSLKGAQLLVNHGGHGKCLYLFMRQYRDAGPGVRLVLHTNICVIGVLFQSHYMYLKTILCPNTGAGYLKSNPHPLPPPPHRKIKMQWLSVSKRHNNYQCMGLFLCMSQLMEFGGQKPQGMLGW
jgi:hypothetical protein